MCPISLPAPSAGMAHASMRAGVVTLLATLLTALLTPPGASAATLILDNGDSLSGTLVEHDAGTVVIEHAVLGRVSVPVTRVAELRDVAEVPGTVSASVPDAVAPPPAEPLRDAWWSDWKRRASLGLSGASGNADNATLNLGFTADYEDADTRWAIKSAYDYGEADSVASDERVFVSADRDWLRAGSPWFGFARARFDWDRFKDWDYRLSGSGGVGHEFVKTDTWRLLGRAGVGGSQTFGGLRADAFAPEGVIGLEADWKLGAHQDLAIANTLYPDLSSSGEYRNQTSLDWTLGMAEEGMDFKVSIANEYDSQASGGTRKNDLTYSASIVWGM